MEAIPACQLGTPWLQPWPHGRETTTCTTRCRFEFFLLVIMLLTCFVNAFDKGRFIYLTYLSLVTVLLTQAGSCGLGNPAACMRDAP